MSQDILHTNGVLKNGAVCAVKWRWFHMASRSYLWLCRFQHPSCILRPTLQPPPIFQTACLCSP